MAALGFILVWVILGLSLFFVAFRGGPRGAREALQSQSARGRRTVTGVVALVFVVFGIAVPVAVLTTNEDQRNAGAAALELTAQQARGRELFAQSCSTCHTLSGANAVGRVGPDLDKLRPPRSLVLDAIRRGRARGAGQMPALLVEGRDARDVAAFVATVAGR